MVGRKAPKGIIVFLTALAIVDDLGAIIVIAIFYTSQISWIALIMGLIVFIALILANRFKVKFTSVYIILGIVLWICCFKIRYTCNNCWCIIWNGIACWKKCS